MTEGIPYFSLDCRFDDKLEEIEDMFGMKGLGIIIKLFQKIYGIHGYYCEWNDRVASRFANREAFVGVDVVDFSRNPEEISESGKVVET